MTKDHPALPVSMEALRPLDLGELRGQAAAIDRLATLAEGARRRHLVPPNLLLHGPPGVGKTTAVRAFARAVLGADFENSFNQLDSGDDRSAEFLRRRVVPIAGAPPSRGAVCRIIFFDDAENLSTEAQQVLRPVLERAASTTVFVLACNDLAALSEPIRSRCILLEFGPVADAAIREVVGDAIARGGLTVLPSTADGIAARAHGIPRDALKLLLEEAARGDGRSA